MGALAVAHDKLAPALIGDSRQRREPPPPRERKGRPVRPTSSARPETSSPAQATSFAAPARLDNSRLAACPGDECLEPGPGGRVTRGAQEDRSLGIDDRGPSREDTGDPRDEDVEELPDVAPREEIGGHFERVDQRVRQTGNYRADVLDIDELELLRAPREALADPVVIGEVDRELVDDAIAAAFEDVDPGDVASDAPDAL